MSGINNLKSLGDRPKEEARAIQSAGGRKKGENYAKRREMKDKWIALRDTPLPKGHSARKEGCKTYGDAWALAMSDKVMDGSVDAMKLILQQMGEEVAEKQEIKIVYNSKEADDLMG